MSFKRYLSEEMIKALTDEYSKNGWWRTLADDKDTLIAIRDNYLSVYYKGGCIAKVEYATGKIEAKIHYKYLLKKKLSDPPYVRCIDGKPQIEVHAAYFINSIGEIADIKSAASVYGGIEKLGVHKIIRANANIVDTEIALSGDESDEENSRIDFCAIHMDNDKLLLRFFEAKHYSYTKALRITTGDAEVIGQLGRYAEVLKRQRENILDQYKKSIHIAGQIEGCNVLGSHWSKSDLDNLDIDIEPRLVVFGFDNDQLEGQVFKKHMDKLRAIIGPRLLLRGSANDFSVGISK